MRRNDVDFPHIRQHAKIEAVLEYYNVHIDGDGKQKRGQCPFHEDERKTLSVNTERNLFRCHACGAEGNIIKLVQLLDDKLANPHQAGLQIAQLSGITPKPNGEKKSAKVANNEAEPKSENNGDGILVNRPLTFQLKLRQIKTDEDSVAHDFIASEGVSCDRLHRLGIGMAERGSMKDRLAVPIVNGSWDLVAYCGRDIGLLNGSKEPLWLFPEKFNRSLELFGWNNAHHFSRVILVEDLWDVVKHGEFAEKYQDGFGIAALMGNTISEAQLALLQKTQPEVIVAMTGREANVQKAKLIAGEIAGARLRATVRMIKSDELFDTVDSETFCELCSADL